MSKENQENANNCRECPGIVLLVTLVLLVLLSTLGYTLTNRLAAYRHRQQYIIDYGQARYACDSAVKYALAALEDINNPPLVIRSDEPDFSDLFWRNEQEYREYLAQWAAGRGVNKSESFGDVNDTNDINDVNDTNDINDVNDTNDFDSNDTVIDLNDPNSFKIRGPYGPLWPFIIEPVEFKIGSATVRVEIEDENAKYPVGWALLDDDEVKREAEAGFETFCEWMAVEKEQIDSLKQQLMKINEIKPFKLELKPIMITEKKTTIAERRREAIRRRSSRGRRGRASQVQTSSKTIPPFAHTADYARLFHSSLIDTEVLARPTVISESRTESALKYMGMWASRQVNINTAPRQVLEAAFTFGGDKKEIAEEIIQRRRIKPFSDIEELRSTLLGYSDSIRKCEKYITTASEFFTIKVTAVAGVAKASAIVGITKEGKKIKKIGVISG